MDTSQHARSLEAVESELEAAKTALGKAESERDTARAGMKRTESKRYATLAELRKAKNEREPLSFGQKVNVMRRGLTP